MFKPRADDRRDLWLPGLVALVGALLSLAGWGLLVAERRTEILAAAERTSSETAEAIALGLDEQVATLTALSKLWSDFGLRPLPEWRANAGDRVDQVPGLVSVAWVDLDEPRNRITAGRDRTPADDQLDTQEAREHFGTPHLSGPERNGSGQILYRVFLPVRSPSDHAGVLVARFLVEPFLETVLHARASGDALSVTWNGERIFARGVPTDDPWQDWWRVERVIELPLGGQWQVVHRPTAEFAAARLTPVPHYLLASAIVLSAVLAILAHQLRVVVRQSRFLAAGNLALEKRGQELEARVAERTAALQDAVLELEAFNYSVSHDLRSPLGAILNFAAILEEDYRGQPLDEAGVTMLGRIRNSATRATDLLEDLLRFSRAGRAALRKEPVDMAALARETFAQTRAAQGEPDVEFLVDALPDASGDRTLLGDVFANLFSNALKYSRDCEKRRVSVSGRIEASEVVYEVADNGKGFDMRYADKLFGVFERLHNDEVEGTGVGLAMVARIVKRHGGRVWAEGEVGKGARFSFSLPRQESA